MTDKQKIDKLVEIVKNYKNYLEGSLSCVGDHIENKNTKREIAEIDQALTDAERK